MMPTFLPHEQLMKIGSALVAYGPDWCAGFFIDKKHIVTAAHCLRDRHPHDIETHLRNGDVVKSEVAYVDFEKDIGILRTKDAHNQEPLSMRYDKLIFGDNLQTAQLIRERGLNGQMFNIEYGKLWSTIDPKDRQMNQWTTQLLETTCRSEKGFSGSPFIFNGEVVGVLVAGNGMESYGVPAKHIREAMKTISSSPKWLSTIRLHRIELNGVW